MTQISHDAGRASSTLGATRSVISRAAAACGRRWPGNCGAIAFAVIPPCRQTCGGAGRGLKTRSPGPASKVRCDRAASRRFRCATRCARRTGDAVAERAGSVENQVLALALCFLQKRADDPATDAVALMAGVDFDAGQVDLPGAVAGIQHADTGLPSGDDLPSVRVESALMKRALNLLVPPPDRRDAFAHGSLVQLGSRTRHRRGWSAAAR
jgi:hypothetical protein